MEGKKEGEKVCWDLAKTGGWNRYEALTNKCSEAINMVVEDKTKTIEQMADKFNKIHEKVKYKSFGKVTLSDRKGNKPQGDVKSDDGDEGEKAKKLLDKQVKILKTPLICICKGLTAKKKLDPSRTIRSENLFHVSTLKLLLHFSHHNM